MRPSVAILRGAAIAAAGAALALAAGSCARRQPPPAMEVVALRSAVLPAAPTDAAWRKAPVFTAPLILQDMVEPRLLVPSTPAVEVQALTDGVQVAFRLAWTDSTMDDLPGAARFSDACAVQLPSQPGANVPAPQMGEPGGTVEITYWTASWQAEVNGRPDSIQALYPNAHIDHYPFEATSLAPGSAAQQEMARRYAPARAAGKPDHPAGRPVQDLLAEGPGTITPAPETRATGAGRYVEAQRHWEVVIVRPLPAALRGQPRSQVAFAVWNGARQEAGARKMRSVWVPLAIGGGA